jgi:hypothetical protein
MHPQKQKNREDRFSEKAEFGSFDFDQLDIGIRHAVKHDSGNTIRLFQKINLAADAGIVL